MRNPVFFVAALLLPVGAVAQSLQSGPRAGSRLGELQVSIVSGPLAGTTTDLGRSFARGPAAILFVHELTRNTAPLLRGFDEGCSELAALGLQGACVLLAGDRTAAEQRAPVVSRSLQLLAPLLVSTDGAEGPGGYALNRKAELTLVLASDGVVVDALAFVDTGRQDLELLQFALDSLVGPPPADDELAAALDRLLPQDRAGLLRVIVQLERQRRSLVLLRDAARNQRGNEPAMRPMAREPELRPAPNAPPLPPADPAANPLLRLDEAELAVILRRIVRQDVDEAALDRAFAELEQCVADAPDRRAQAVRVSRAILEGRDYGNEPARRRLQAFVARHGGHR